MYGRYFPFYFYLFLHIQSYKMAKQLKQKDIVTCLEPCGNKVWIGTSLGDIKIYRKKVLLKQIAVSPHLHLFFQKDYKTRELRVDGSIGCMLYVPPSKMWIGTDKSIVIFDTTVYMP